MISDIIKSYLQEICTSEFDYNEPIIVDFPDDAFGDLTTNCAMKIAKTKGENPREVAERIAKKLRLQKEVKTVDVAGPGFVNVVLNDDVLIAAAQAVPEPQTYKGQTVVVEYSDPNPFKELHVGHLYTSVIGDAMANLIAAGGGEVHRVNFGGDVGMHVAKAVWGILQALEGEHPEKLSTIADEQHATWLSQQYVAGSNAFENDAQAKTEITDINKRLYDVVSSGDRQSPLAQIYWTCRQWSYDYFDEFYKSIGSGFERYYPESENAQLGLDTVKKHVGTVYEESKGAIVFAGEKYGLHTRVFVNNEGLPTYEAKDVGVAIAKWNDYRFDKSVIITANDITEYMKVVVKSIEQFEPEIAKRTLHITHGNVKMKGGVKMSSRLGNVLRAVDVVNTVREVAMSMHENSAHDPTLAAIKFGFLKQRVGPDVIFEIEESVSLEGKSGPYLQYAFARANSILSKAQSKESTTITDLDDDERLLLRYIARYQLILDDAVRNLQPHLIAAYLYDLAQQFNRFYESNRIIDSDRSDIRIGLVQLYKEVLGRGLQILNIEAPEKI